jgi:hypothetical protein
MAKFHVVPRGDATQHDTRGGTCSCVVETRTFKNDDGSVDLWVYHRVVSLDEAISLSEASTLRAA